MSGKQYESSRDSIEERTVKTLKGISPRLARRIARHRDEIERLLTGE